MDNNNVRRSSRRSTTKKPPYKEGDIVEVHAPNTTDVPLKVQLVSKLEDIYKSPRWLVLLPSSQSDGQSKEFDNESWSQEEMEESVFGNIVGKGDAPVKTKRTNRKRTTSSSTASPLPATDSKQGSPVAVSSINGEDDINHGKKRRKSVDISEAHQNPSDSSSSVVVQGSTDVDKRTAAAVAREERSKRRQALLEEEKKNLVALAVRASPSGRNSSSNHNNKKQKTKHSTSNSLSKDVVRVALLTGTLYLYRGRRRRAEFVPKV